MKSKKSKKKNKKTNKKKEKKKEKEIKSNKKLGIMALLRNQSAPSSPELHGNLRIFFRKKGTQMFLKNRSDC